MNNNYFDIQQDIAIANDGGFFCQSCIVGKHEDEASPDFRYCGGCYKLLMEDADILSPSKGIQAWVPRHQEHQRAYESPPPMQLDMGEQEEVLLHTKTESSHAYQNHTEDRPIPNVGGRPKKNIPIKLIHRLSEQGLSIGRIVKELKGQGQIISAMTVSRALSGRRN